MNILSIILNVAIIITDVALIVTLIKSWKNKK